MTLFHQEDHSVGSTPPGPSRTQGRHGGRLRWVTRRDAFPVLLTGVLSFLIAIASARIRGMPPPRVHDEFSYLLAADTFAQGRLTNPTHPLWRHFESFHIIQRPTYASKYPPGQGLILAAGQVAFGSPAVGVWMSTALACAAIVWMLEGWVPRRWALVGGLLAALHPLILTWNRCYWGGAVAACGGALVLGAVGRPARRPRAGAGIAMGSGMTILAISRPYEGLVLTILAVVTLLVRTARRVGPPVPVLLRRVAAPALVILAPAVVGIAHYNDRVTGRIDRMPYMVHEQTYAVVPIFAWQPLRSEPSYQHREIQEFHTRLLVGRYERLRTPEGFLGGCLSKLRLLASNTFPAVGVLMMFITIEPSDPLFRSFVWSHIPILILQLPLLICTYLLLGTGMRLPTVLLLAFSAALMPSVWTSEQYASPALALVLLLTLQSMRHMQRWKLGNLRVGATLSWIAVAMYVVWGLPSFSHQSKAGDSFDDWPLARSMADRAQIQSRLSEVEGGHLVIVRYAPGHNLHAEWVYNAADIDGSKVVWAREMDAAANRELLAYFRDRRAWLLLPDKEPPDLIPVSPDDSGELRID
jgi:hypothetical protein